MCCSCSRWLSVCTDYNRWMNMFCARNRWLTMFCVCNTMELRTREALQVFEPRCGFQDHPFYYHCFDYLWLVLMNWDEIMLVSWLPALLLLHRPLAAQSSCVFQWVRIFSSALYCFWSCFTLKMHSEVSWWFYWYHLVINTKVNAFFKKLVGGEMLVTPKDRLKNKFRDIVWVWRLGFCL